MNDHGTCPRCKSAMEQGATTIDGVVWRNERCTNRCCIYETEFRLVSSPIRQRHRSCPSYAFTVDARDRRAWSWR